MSSRVEFILVALLVCFCSNADAQDKAKRKRFKHEKHGAIVFAEGDGYELKCDIYQPNSDEPCPVMLAIHGGAWTTGTKFAMLRHARILANRGYVVMAINYRLAPQYKWPAQIHDCKHAVRWIRENAEQYNADPDRVYAFGYSAGGHLASLLATTDVGDGLEGKVAEPYSKHSSRISGLIAGGSPMEFSWVNEDSTTLTYWLEDTRGDNPEKYANASPISFVTEDDPVAVLFHGTADSLVPHSSPKEFLEQCQQCNVDSELILTSDGHASAFTRTSLLIESLAKFEKMLAKRRCNEKLSEIIDLIDSFNGANSRFPESVDELQQFAQQKSGIDAESFKTMMFNERDNQPFEICWNSDSGPIISEAIGLDGNKLSKRVERK